MDVHFHGIELLFLGHHLVDVGCEEWVRGCELLAQGARDGGLDLGLGARGDTVEVLVCIPIQWRIL